MPFQKHIDAIACIIGSSAGTAIAVIQQVEWSNIIPFTFYSILGGVISLVLKEAADRIKNNKSKRKPTL